MQRSAERVDRFPCRNPLLAILMLGLAAACPCSTVLAFDPLAGDSSRGDPLDVRIVTYNHHGDFIVAPSRDAAFKRDGDVDQSDLDDFEGCASGPDVPLAPGCEGKDFDGDEDVDQSDFGRLQRCLSGENVPGDPGC